MGWCPRPESNQLHIRLPSPGFLLDAAQLESDPDDRHLRNVTPADLIALGKSRTWTADE